MPHIETKRWLKYRPSISPDHLIDDWEQIIVFDDVEDKKKFFDRVQALKPKAEQIMSVFKLYVATHLKNQEDEYLKYRERAVKDYHELKNAYDAEHPLFRMFESPPDYPKLQSSKERFDRRVQEIHRLSNNTLVAVMDWIYFFPTDYDLFILHPDEQVYLEVLMFERIEVSSVENIKFQLEEANYRYPDFNFKKQEQGGTWRWRDRETLANLTESNLQGKTSHDNFLDYLELVRERDPEFAKNINLDYVEMVKERDPGVAQDMSLHQDRDRV